MENKYIIENQNFSKRNNIITGKYSIKIFFEPILYIIFLTYDSANLVFSIS